MDSLIGQITGGTGDVVYPTLDLDFYQKLEFHSASVFFEKKPSIYLMLLYFHRKTAKLDMNRSVISQSQS